MRHGADETGGGRKRQPESQVEWRERIAGAHEHCRGAQDGDRRRAQIQRAGDEEHARRNRGPGDGRTARRDRAVRRNRNESDQCRRPRSYSDAGEHEEHERRHARHISARDGDDVVGAGVFHGIGDTLVETGAIANQHGQDQRRRLRVNRPDDPRHGLADSTPQRRSRFGPRRCAAHCLDQCPALDRPEQGDAAACQRDVLVRHARITKRQRPAKGDWRPDPATARPLREPVLRECARDRHAHGAERRSRAGR